jgi:hypothetical protein
LIGITGKDGFGGNTGGVGLAGDGIKDVKARADIMAGVDVTMTT